MLPEVGLQSPNHWTIRELPILVCRIPGFCQGEMVESTDEVT